MFAVQIREGEKMLRLPVALGIAAVILFAASPVSKTGAASWPGTANIGAAGPYSPIRPAACGAPGPHCPPGTVWRCGYYGRCWCAPC